MRAMKMMHDYAHCFDYRKSCPADCFRAQLERDLELRRTELACMGITYAHFRGTPECKKGVKRNGPAGHTDA